MKSIPNTASLIMAVTITIIAVLRGFSGGSDIDRIFGVIAVFACMVFVIAYRMGLRKQDKEKSE